MFVVEGSNMVSGHWGHGGWNHALGAGGGSVRASLWTIWVGLGSVGTGLVSVGALENAKWA